METNTVNILKEIGMDYFSHNVKGMTDLNDTVYSNLYCQWQRDDRGFQANVELARVNKVIKVVVVGDDGECYGKFSFTMRGIERAINRMYYLCED